MLNKIHSWLHRPEKGWDPISKNHLAFYTEYAWQMYDEAVLDELEREIGSLRGLDVLDLGGGPGQYTIGFARRGCNVVWHDVSHGYRDFALEKAKQAGVLDSIQFSIGYMDEAPSILKRQFDLVFNRGCFFYGFSESSFIRVILSLIRPGGYGYIDTHHSRFKRDELSLSALFRTVLNEKTGLKIGHPHPPRGRIPAILAKMPIERMIVDFSMDGNDRILFRRKRGFESSLSGTV
jgi:2-polyprenyl-3-methyl-5-hydroxy-6-metoxy-1,4-benzoquinol methylase